MKIDKEFSQLSFCSVIHYERHYSQSLRMVWEKISTYMRNSHMTRYIILKDLLFNKAFFVVVLTYLRSQAV